MDHRGLGPLESTVMDVVWDAGAPVTVRTVTQSLENNGPAYTTVATVLDNLHGKGWVERERRGLVWFYRPSLDRSERAAHLMGEALAHSDLPEVTLLRFVDTMSPEDRDRLRRLVEEAAQRAPRGED